MIRAVPPMLALAAVRAVFAWPLAHQLAAPLLAFAAQHPRGEAALLDHGAVLLIDLLRDPDTRAPSPALVLAASAGVALASLVPTSWVVTACAYPRMPLREAFFASLRRVPDLSLAWGLTSLLVAALGALGARLVGAVFAAEPGLPSLSPRTAAIVGVAFGPALLAAPWADVARVHAVLRGGDPLDELRAALHTLSRWGVLRAWATWAAFAFAELAVLGLVLAAFASSLVVADEGPATAILAPLVLVAALAPPWLRSLWLARVAERFARARASDAHEGLPPSSRLEYESTSSPSDTPR